MKKTTATSVAMRAGHVVTTGNVMGSPRAAFAMNHDDWANPHKIPLKSDGNTALLDGNQGAFRLHRPYTTKITVEANQIPTKLANT